MSREARGVTAKSLLHKTTRRLLPAERPNSPLKVKLQTRHTNQAANLLSLPEPEPMLLRVATVMRDGEDVTGAEAECETGGAEGTGATGTVNLGAINLLRPRKNSPVAGRG
jgi:hypothetical protein